MSLVVDVLSAIIGQARTNPTSPAVRDLDRDLTYAELNHEVGRVSAGLTASGVTAGDRVALHLGNSVDWVVAALACLWVGAIFVPLAVTDPESRRASILEDCAPTLVVTPDQRAEHGTEPSPALLPRFASAEISQLRVSEGTAPDRVPPSDKVAYAIYTSGTTGTPKGVLIGNLAFAAAVDEASKALGFNADTRALCVSPVHFDGSFGTVFPTLYSGGLLIMRPRDALLFPRTFFHTVEQEGINLTSFSPSYLRILLASPQISRLIGTSLKIVALGGEACGLADVEALRTVAPHLRVFNRYGPTEAAIAVSHVELTRALLATGTVPIGRPHPGVTFHLIDEQGRAVDRRGQLGELCIGGRQLMAGYWGAPELTAQVLRSDIVPGQVVYRSGDLMYRDDSGNYVYVDRADRVIKRNGVRISLVELSDVIRHLAGVTAAACVRFDNDGQLGIAAFVVGAPWITPIQLRRGARDRLPDTMLPDRISVVDTLPMTSSSKLDERRLLADAGLRVPPTAGR